MKKMEILQRLNKQQQQAVTDDAHIIRIIAGAGSGKTRVLVQRMQWLINIENISPYALLALTFTNKSAKQIARRLTHESSLPYLWIGTFHAICHRILRKHASLMGWSTQFNVIDKDDQLRLIKRILRTEKTNGLSLAPEKILWQINKYKENGLRADKIPSSAHPIDILICKIYKNYEHICQQQGTVDFNELLLLTVELLQTHNEIRNQYREQFSSVLIDEFKDTFLLSSYISKEQNCLLSVMMISLFIAGAVPK